MLGMLKIVNLDTIFIRKFRELHGLFHVVNVPNFVAGELSYMLSFSD